MNGDVWQNCPKCKGNGSVSRIVGVDLPVNFVTDYNTIECNICKGSGIISKITGLPPNK